MNGRKLTQVTPEDDVEAIVRQDGTSSLASIASSSRNPIRAKGVRSFQFLLRALAIAVLGAVCCSVGFIYGAHVVTKLHEEELASVQVENRELKQQHSRVATQASFLRTVFEDLVNSSDQTRQIQDKPRARRERSRPWFAVGGGSESRAPIYRSRGSSEILRDEALHANEQPVSSNVSSRVLKTDAAIDIAPKMVPGVDASMVIERWARIFENLPLGIPVDGYISSSYGNRTSPTSGRWQFHSGLDFAVDHDTNAVATGSGIVREVGYKGAYGLSVTIDHGNGWKTVYGHLSAITAKIGQHICRGQTVGRVGSTGNSTGPHLHYEVRRHNYTRNPVPFVEFPRVARVLLKLFS